MVTDPQEKKYWWSIQYSNGYATMRMSNAPKSVIEDGRGESMGQCKLVEMLLLEVPVKETSWGIHSKNAMIKAVSQETLEMLW